MTYSTYSAPARAGFSFTSSAAAVCKGISGFFDSLMRAMIVNSTAQRRLTLVEQLNAKTDAELAVLGLRREDIVRHVFRDVFWN